jgi:hypothetical protein
LESAASVSVADKQERLRFLLKRNKGGKTASHSLAALSQSVETVRRASVLTSLRANDGYVQHPSDAASYIANKSLLQAFHGHGSLYEILKLVMHPLLKVCPLQLIYL